MNTEKTIDGLSVRRANSSRAAKMKPSPRSVVKKHIPIGVPNDPLKLKAKQAAPKPQPKAAPAARPKPIDPTAARADFLKPVETFDFDITSDDLKSAKKTRKKLDKSMKPTPSHAKSAAPSSKKAKKKPSKARRIITTILLILVVLIIGGVVWVLIWGNDIIAKLTGGNSSIFSAIGALTSENYVELKTDTNGRTNILVLGTSGYDMDGTVGDHTYDGSQLTDSIMAIGLDQKSGDIVMTSIPRDLKVPAACYSGKINEVYLCHSKDGKDDAAGAEALIKSVSEVLGINFQYYAHINWGSLVKIVNSLGGVTVTLDEDVYDPNYTKANVKAGIPTTLDGEEALALARARHGTAGGDFTRGTSQQKILIGIKDKISSKLEEGSFDLGTALNLVQALGDNLRTNISIEEIKTGVHLISDLDLNQMRQVMLYDYNNYSTSLMKTANINGLSYVIPTAGAGNYTHIHQLIAKEFSTNAITREAAKILLLNGTETSGLAATEGKYLESEGYIIAELGNAPDGEYTERYSIYQISDTVPGTLQELRGLYNTEIKSSDDLPSDIDLTAYDIVIILGDN